MTIDLEGVISSLSWYARKSAACFESGTEDDLKAIYGELKDDVSKYINLMSLTYTDCNLLKFKRLEQSDAYPNIPEGICLMLIPLYFIECVSDGEAYKNILYDDVIIDSDTKFNPLFEYGCLDIGIPFDISEAEGKYYE